ncbi:hypothetical protein JOC54_001306 [Alkalihalobacillus xiaoxiensis]|uniref:Uncharacterized protein n=1 Tax=Shouchella xiaoxiensis TaxID=766895 RepID=A0ABS2SRD4_9BACI|nr:hypothetical protein [Shouchella xiaoxiensis]MBM7838075.1 hypothetical protein [Shouchella xiaoxiensis]
MKNWKNRALLLGISLVFGLIMGVQLMSEYAGLNEPKPLQIQESTVEKQHEVPVVDQTELAEKEPLTTARETKGMSNFFSDLGSTFATGVENTTRSGLEKVVGAVRNGINKENERHPQENKSSY